MNSYAPGFDLDLIEKHFSGTLTAAERETFDRWLAVRPAHGRIVEALHAVWTSCERSGETWDVQAMWNTLAVRMGLAEQESPAMHGERVRRTAVPPMFRWGAAPGSWRWFRIVWSAAAVFVIGAVGVVVGWDGYARHLVAHGPGRVTSYVTANGERANVTLPDGGTVTLSVASRLDVPVDYAAGNHTVHLSGEALFTVPQHEGKPFTVIAGDVAARVLGTSFAVRHYDADSTSIVAVREGKVAVGRVVVPAARMIEIGRQGNTHLGNADASQFSFASGTLQLPSMPLANAVTELNRWYGADIRFGDASFARIPIKGTFVAGSLSELSEMLEFMLHARIVRSGRTLTLYPQGRN